MSNQHPPKARAKAQQAREEQNILRRRMTVFTSFCLVFLLLAISLEHSSADVPLLVRVFYLLAYISGGYFALKRAWQELMAGHVNVDLLMIVAAIGAAVVGEWPEGGILLFLFSLSNTLEQIVLGRTRQSIEALMDMTPETATVIRHDRELKVGIEELQLDDIVLVRPGERIAGDGLVVSGNSSVDQSVITGESIPVDKYVGDEVFAGTLNQAGAIKIRVIKRPEETTLARIIQLVEEAQSAKADSERFTNWFGEKYTIAVLFGAALTCFVYYSYHDFSFFDAVYKAMTVLVVASPCAVVISIPAAILAAIAAGARAGLLFKGGAHLERMAQVRVIAFDKTGTLTVGRPQVTEVVTVLGTTKDEVLRIAASAETLSEHPLAKAVVKAAKDRGFVLEQANDLQAIIGFGVTAEIKSQSVLIGKKELFLKRSIELPDAIVNAAEELTEGGNTVIFVGSATAVLGIIALADQMRSSAYPAIKEIYELGVSKIVMLTGDNERVAQAMASKLGIDFASDLLPQEKVARIKLLADEYGQVAMVGDGINDAPSLASATVGVSLGGSATAVALETADVVLMGENLRLVPFAISLGRSTRRIIAQNLIFAFSGMLLLLTLSLGADLRLPYAVAGHEGSTVLVILNGLRLLKQRPKL